MSSQSFAAKLRLRWHKRTFRRQERMYEIFKRSLDSPNALPSLPWPNEEAWLKSKHVQKKDVKVFVNQILGKVVTPFNHGRKTYEKARFGADHYWNVFPWMIVYCDGVSDVKATIDFSRKFKVSPICGRSGGHSYAGYSVCDKGIILDLSRRNQVIVSHDELKAEICPGVNFNHLYSELEAFNLHTPGGTCPSVCVAGFGMGGGFGYTSRKFGMNCDNMIGLTMVDSRGKIRQVTEENDKDGLLWAVRGGTGNNFGIITSFTYRVYHLPDKVCAISLILPLEKAADAFLKWQEFFTINPDTEYDNISLIYNLVVMKDGKKAELDGIYYGDNEKKCRKLLAPFDELNPTIKIKIMPFSKANAWADDADSDTNESINDLKKSKPKPSKDEAEEFDRKSSRYAKRKWTKDDINLLIKCFNDGKEDYSVYLEGYGGAINRKKRTDTAFVHRDAFFNLVLEGVWTDQEGEKQALAWLKDSIAAMMKTGSLSNEVYQNYPERDLTNWSEAYFMENYARLRKVKTKFDRDNFFKFQQGIVPLPPIP